MNFKLRVGRLSRCVGIIVIALLVMAAGAKAAGEWKIAEKTMSELEASEASISGTASESFKLAIAWYASEIECSTLTSEAPTKIFKGGTSEAILKLSTCQILGPPPTSETCKLIQPIELKVVGELLPFAGNTYELFKAPTGKTSLGTIKFKEGTECPLPLSNELKGMFVGATETGERKEQPLTFDSTIEAAFGGGTLSFGTHPATFKGKSVWTLAAGYKGLTWAAIGEKMEKTWQLLLNGAEVEELHLGIAGLEVKLKAKNGLTYKCSGMEGLAIAKKVEGGLKVTGTTKGTFKGCFWVGSEKTCTINDGGVGLIKFGSGVELEMPDADTYILNFVSAGFATIYTEGVFCTIPEEEVLSGSFHVLIEDALADAKLKLGKTLNLKIFLGLSELTELTGEVHIYDYLNPEATIGIHLAK